MSVTKTVHEKGSKIPFSTTTLTLVYGDLEYIRSVFGTDAVTRDMIIEYFEEARASWLRDSYLGISWHSLKHWCNEQGIGRLHYYAPPSGHTIYFKQVEHLFLFKLKFGSS